MEKVKKIKENEKEANRKLWLQESRGRKSDRDIRKQ